MSEKKELSTIEQLQSEFKKGGDVLDQFNHQLTEGLYDSLSAHNVMTDLDSLYDIIQKSVATTVGVWAGGNTEPIVSHDAEKLAEEQKEENPDLDTHKERNDPDLNLALSGSRNPDEKARFEKASQALLEDEPAKKASKSTKASKKSEDEK